MIISKTPYRISFFGGGTDYPDWYKKNDGAVISSTINKYSYISINQLSNIFDYKVRLRYFYREEESLIDKIKHPSVRETLKFLKVKEPLDIVHFGELPAATGIGSSSAFTVGLLNALYKFKNKKINKKKLSNEAIFIEQKKIGENVGSQDQVASAYGGLNFLEFKRNNIKVSKLKLLSNNLEIISDNIFLIYTGIQRHSKNITKKLKHKTLLNENRFFKIYESTLEAKKIFQTEKIDFKNLGEILNYQWSLKKELTNNVTNKKIDDMLRMGIKMGAYGGKICGAGGGGFILFLAPKSKKIKFKKKFKNMFVDIKISKLGSVIL